MSSTAASQSRHPQDFNRVDLERYVMKYLKWPESNVKRETAIALLRLLEHGHFPLPPPRHSQVSAPEKRPTKELKTAAVPPPTVHVQTTTKPSTSVVKSAGIPKPPASAQQKQQTIGKQEGSVHSVRNESDDEEEDEDDRVWTPVVRCLLCDRLVPSVCVACHHKTCSCGPMDSLHQFEKTNPFTGSSFIEESSQSIETKPTTINNKKPTRLVSEEISSTQKDIDALEWSTVIHKVLWSLQDQLRTHQETNAKLMEIQEHMKGDCDFDQEDAKLLYGEMQRNQQNIWSTCHAYEKELQNYRSFIERRHAKEQAIVDKGYVGSDVAEKWQKKHTERIKNLDTFVRKYEQCEEWMRKMTLPVPRLPVGISLGNTTAVEQPQHSSTITTVE